MSSPPHKKKAMRLFPSLNGSKKKSKKKKKKRFRYLEMQTKPWLAILDRRSNKWSGSKRDYERIQGALKKWFMVYVSKTKDGGRRRFRRDALEEMITNHCECLEFLEHKFPGFMSHIKQNITNYEYIRNLSSSRDVSAEITDGPFDPSLTQIGGHAILMVVTCELLAEHIRSIASPSTRNPLLNSIVPKSWMWNASRVYAVKCMDILLRSIFANWRGSEGELGVASRGGGRRGSVHGMSKIKEMQRNLEMMEAARRIDNAKEMHAILQTVTARRSIANMRLDSKLVSTGRHLSFMREENEEESLGFAESNSDEEEVDPAKLEERVQQLSTFTTHFLKDAMKVAKRQEEFEQNHMPKAQELYSAMSSVESFILEMRGEGNESGTQEKERCDYSHRRPSVFETANKVLQRRRSSIQVIEKFAMHRKKRSPPGFSPRGGRGGKVTMSKHFLKMLDVSDHDVQDDEEPNRALSESRFLPIFQSMVPFWRQRLSLMKRVKYLKDRRARFLFISSHLHDQVQHQQTVLDIATRKWESHCVGAVMRIWSSWTKVKKGLRQRANQLFEAKRKFSNSIAQTKRNVRSRMRRWTVEARKRKLRRKLSDLENKQRRLFSMKRRNNQIEACATLAEFEEEKQRQDMLNVLLDYADQNRLLRSVISKFGNFVELKEQRLCFELKGHSIANAAYAASLTASAAFKSASAAAMSAQVSLAKAQRVWYKSEEISGSGDMLRKIWNSLRLPQNENTEHCLTMIQNILKRNGPILRGVFKYYAAIGSASIRALQSSVRVMDLDGLKAMLSDVGMLGHNLAFARVQLLYQTTLKSQNRSSELDFKTFLAVLVKTAHIVFFLEYKSKLNKSYSDYSDLVSRKGLEMCGLKGIGLISLAGDNKVRTIRTLNESMELPPGLVDHKQLEGHAMVLALQETIENCIVSKAKYFIPEPYRARVFGNEKIRRIVLQNLSSLYNIFKFYSELSPAEINAELGNDITTSQEKSTGSPTHGPHDRTMGIEHVRVLMQHCSGGGASSTSGVGIGDLRKLFAFCQRPKFKASLHSSPVKSPTVRRVRRRRNSIRPGKLNSRKSGLKFAPGLTLIGETDLGGALDMSSLANTINSSSQNKDKETKINFATFVEFIIVAAEYFDRNPFVVTRSKISRFLKTTLFQKCKTESGGKFSATSKEDLNEYFFSVEAKAASRDSKAYMKFRSRQMHFMKLHPYGIYRAKPDVMLARAKDNLFESLCRVALSNVQPLHITLQKKGVSPTSRHNTGDDLHRLKSITGAVRTTKRSVFYSADVSSSEEEDEEEIASRKIDPPPGLSLLS